MGPQELERFCALDAACQQLMQGAFDRMGLTARSYDRILRVARTIADLDEQSAIQLPHAIWPEACQYRPHRARAGVTSPDRSETFSAPAGHPRRFPI